MRKIIKKILNLLGWLVLSLTLLAIVLTIVINSPDIQNYITKKAFGRLEERLGNCISYTGIRLHLFNKAEFSDLLITDQDTDTIIFAPTMQASFPGLLRKVLFHKEWPFRLGSLSFDKSVFRLRTDTNGVLNIQFIIDSLAAPRDTSAGQGKPAFINKIKVKDSRFALINDGGRDRGFGIDFSHMYFTDLNFLVKGLVVRSDTVKFDIKELAFLEKSGFRVENLKSQFNYSRKFLRFDNLYVETSLSQFQMSKLYFDYDNVQSFNSDKIFTNVHLDMNCESSSIYLHELSYFVRFFDGMKEKVDFKGEIGGTLSNLDGRGIQLQYGRGTHLKGRFDMSGLPDISSTFLVFDIDGFETKSQDMLSFLLPGGKLIKLPDKISSITSFSYTGNYTGFFKDFVSYGTINTNLGVLKTDVMFEPDSVNRVRLSGQLSSQHFNIGRLLGASKNIGDISLNIKLDGLSRINAGFDIDVDGDIDQFLINGYNYRNISVDGLFSQNKFNGKLNVDDPNLRMNFDGLVDLSSQVRRYNFQANVLYANLYALNITKADSNYTGSFLMRANLSGNKLDDLNGNVKLINSLFAKSDAQIQVYDLQLDIENDSLGNNLKLTSDFMDAQIQGHYRLSQLPDEYMTLVNKFLPALIDSLKPKKLLSKCDLNYRVEFKNSIPFFMFFSPEYAAQPHTTIKGEFKRDSLINAKIHIESPGIVLKNTVIDQMVLNSKTDSGEMKIDVGCKNLNLSNRVQLANFTFLSDIDSNYANFKVRWINWDSALYRGNLSGNLALLGKANGKNRMFVNIDSSKLVIKDSVWALSPFSVLADTNKFVIRNFALWHRNQYMTVNGNLSDNIARDSLFCEFNSFDFANLNFLTRSEAFRFGGILNGDAVIKGFKSPLFFASLFVKNLQLNGESIGDTKIESQWKDDIRAVNVNAVTNRGTLNTLKISGNFYPGGNNLDFKLDLDKFRLDFINPYLSSVFSDIRGVGTGILTLKGTSAEPKLNGEINLQKAAFTVDYLKTRYNFTSNLGISNNNLIFDNITMYDIYGNTAQLNGVIQTGYFRKYNLNLTINTDKFLCMNTTKQDNNMFFGTAFATGIIRITGEPATLKFDVTSRTEPGTVFNIPVSETEDLSEYTFIKFIDKDSSNSATIKEDYKVNLTGLQLDFNLKVTPDATVKIIFDPTMGDEMEGKGSGDMRISINTQGDFKIVGNYVIDEGTYLFTLQDVLVNWKFNVEQGSTLRWSGDPINADVNINTYYRTKASLGDLFPADSSLKRSSKKTVDCEIGLTGKLMQPNINYDISLPYAEPDVKEKVAASISTEEEKGKQFLALLFMKRFLPAISTGAGNNTIGGGEVANANASELLSNQLSNWLSQISKDVDVDVNYRPGSEKNPQEVEVALSTQLLNDKLSINGSVDMKTNAEAQKASSILGDVDIDYKLTKSGRLRTRVFNRANENEVENLSPYTQGVGIFYTEEFDKFSDLLKKYRANLKKGRKSDDNEKHGEDLKNKEATKSKEDLLN